MFYETEDYQKCDVCGDYSYSCSDTYRIFISQNNEHKDCDSLVFCETCVNRLHGMTKEIVSKKSTCLYDKNGEPIGVLYGDVYERS